MSRGLGTRLIVTCVRGTQIQGGHDKSRHRRGMITSGLLWGWPCSPKEGYQSSPIRLIVEKHIQTNFSRASCSGNRYNKLGITIHLMVTVNQGAYVSKCANYEHPKLSAFE